MIRGGISENGIKDLVLIKKGTMNEHSYIEEDHVGLFVQLIGDKFVLMDDNAKAHIARIVTKYLVKSLHKSKTLNPIERVWDITGRQVRARVDLKSIVTRFCLL